VRLLTRVLFFNLFFQKNAMDTLNTGTIFADRTEAGRMLGQILAKSYRNKHALVLGIPRGGIVVAYEIARELNAELSVVITKKLPHPSHDEFAIGAAAEDGSVYLSSGSAGISFDNIQKIIRDQNTEIESRVKRFRHGADLPDMQNRIVILADDGIATGSTLVAAVKLCRERRAAWIVVAAPVSGPDVLPELKEVADEVVIFQQPNSFHAVGQVYMDFHQLTDSEVIAILEDYNRSLQPVNH
jgi:putative phosphoribosyl transferase